MPRYLIQRLYDPIGDEEMQDMALRSKSLIIEHFPDVVWEHSHVVTDDSGAISSFCVYAAPTEKRIHEHADLLGGHLITSIREIVVDVRPEDFTR